MALAWKVRALQLGAYSKVETRMIKYPNSPNSRF